MIRNIFKIRFNMNLSKLIIGIIIPTFLLTSTSPITLHTGKEEFNIHNGTPIRIDKNDTSGNERIDIFGRRRIYSER